MPRGLNGTHRELSLAGAVVLVIWRPPALQAREDPSTNGEYGSVRFPQNSSWPASKARRAAARAGHPGSKIGAFHIEYALPEYALRAEGGVT